jgi:hypothetical protein
LVIRHRYKATTATREKPEGYHYPQSPKGRIMTTPARTYQDLLAEIEAYEPSVVAEATATARAIAEALGDPTLALMADAVEARTDH